MQENNWNNSPYSQNQPGDNHKKPKKKMKFCTKVIAAVSGALVIGVLGGIVWQFSSITGELMNGGRSSLEEQLKKDTYKNEEPLTETKVLSKTSLDNSVTKVVEDNIASIVAITSKITSTTSFFGQEYSQEAQGAGSGIIMDEDDKYYYVATNNHVVTGASSITVTFNDGKDAKGTVKGTDTTGDLAVVTVKKSDLKDSTKKAIKTAALGESSDCTVGEQVIAIGNALGLGQSATVGYISALDRDVDIENVSMKLIQTDAAINGGNSGGALLNTKGEVIGINSSKLVDTTVEGVCFAIPISNAKTILKELMSAQEVKDGEEGYIGIAGTAITSEDSSTYNMPVGVYVSEIPKGSAAESAGIQVGDIITKMNGVGVSTVESLVNRANSYKAGTKVKLTVERYNNGTYEDKELTLVLMSKAKFNKLEYSSKTVKGSGNGQSGNDSGSSDGGSINGGGNGSNGDSSGDVQDFYDYFKKYFENNN